MSLIACDPNPLNDHLKNVVNPTWNFAKRLKTWDDHVLNAVIGLAAEAGEVLDEHKKFFFHTEKDKTKEFISEIGDVCYYLVKLLELHGFTLEEVLAANKEKLESRHPELNKVTERFSGDYIR